MALIGEVNMNAQHARFPVTQGNECYARPWEIYSRRLATAPAPILGGRNYTKVYKERLRQMPILGLALPLPPRVPPPLTLRSNLPQLAPSRFRCVPAGPKSLLSWARLQWFG
jgi:hypothetical protein